MPVLTVKPAATAWPVWSRPPGEIWMVSGPDARPAVENVALRSSVAHLRSAIWPLMVALMVTGSIWSLKASFKVAPGSISIPSFRAVPSPAVMATTRGMMIVVKVQWPPFTWWPLTSRIGLRSTV
jgi:hypothetical protein